MARPMRTRPEPPVMQSPAVSGDEKSFVVGALNVYESSVFGNLPRGGVVKVRLLEGFSSEEGFADMFGLTEFDGQSRYGEVPVYADGSFAAKVPANVPLHMQLIDKFAMSVATEDIWISGRPGEQRFCGGCHEDRAKNTVIAPGSTEAVQRGAINLDVPRAERKSADFSYEKIRGVPWNLAIQPIFDAKCVSCHDGDATKPGNRSYTVVDRTLGTMQTFTFDLRCAAGAVHGRRAAGLRLPRLVRVADGHRDGAGGEPGGDPGGGRRADAQLRHAGQRTPVAADQEAEPAPALPRGEPGGARLRRGRPTPRTSAARS